MEDGVGWQHAFNRFARFEEADEDLRTAALAAMEQCMRTPLGAVDLLIYLIMNGQSWLHVCSFQCKWSCPPCCRCSSPICM